MNDNLCARRIRTTQWPRLRLGRHAFAALRQCIACACLGGIASLAWGEVPPPVLTLHIVQRTDKAPVIDGKLDDACWETARQNTTFYEYNNLIPTPTPLRTVFQLAYDEKGVYLAIKLYEKDMKKLKATITQRGDQNLWMDDSVEIYFDSNATSIGFRKFIVNALATQSSLYRMDPANVDPAWSPEGWQVATSKDDKAWYLEGFFPWCDLGKSASDGDLWRFALCRFSWAAGHLASSAVGASYTAPERYGWILFLDAKDRDVNALAKQLANRIPGKWLLPINDKVIVNEQNRVSITTIGALLRDLRNQTRAQADECQKLRVANPAVSNNCAAIIQNLASVTVDTQDAAIFLQSVGKFGAISKELEDFRYASMLNQLFTTYAPNKL